MARIEECKKCQKPFAVTAGENAPMQDYEDIDCPHCGDMWGKERAASVYFTQPLTPEQEKEYSESKKR
jgi:hypothetical protein